MALTTQVGEGWFPVLNGRGEGALLQEIALLEQVADRVAPVLVADDMQTMRLILAQALRQAGFMNVERAADGEEAFKIMQQRGCGLALVDWNMPRMDGLQLLDKVRSHEKLKNLVFIMVTAETMDIKVIRAAEEKQDAYLTKPISPEKLARRLDLILERRLTAARALLLEVQGKWDQAVDTYMAASQNRPRAYWPMFGLGGLLSRLGRWDEAERCYQRILDQDPAVSAALLELGRLRQAQGRLAEARELFQTALRDSPRFFKAYDALARAKLAEGDAPGALEVLGQVMGRLQLELERYPEAESAFRKALKLKPMRHQMENHLQLGRALLGQGRHQEAAEALEHAAKEAAKQKCDVECVQAMILAGTALAQSGDLTAADAMFQRIQDPDNWSSGEPPWEPAYCERKIGEAFLQAGIESLAVRHFSVSLTMSQGGEAAIEQLCKDSGGPDLVEKLKQAKEVVQQERAEDCARRGLDLVAAGKLQEALAEYRRGLEVDPGSGRLYFNLGRLYYRMGEGGDALGAMISAARLGLERNDWELMVEAARFFASAGRLQQARNVLNVVQDQAPEYAPALELWQVLQDSDSNDNSGEPRVSSDGSDF
jgi:two-component system chemotaxis response regulator CheY